LAKQEFGGYTSQTAKTFSSFTVISLVDAREGSFPFRSCLEKVLKFCPLAEKRGSLEGVRERGLFPPNDSLTPLKNNDSSSPSLLPSRFFGNLSPAGTTHYGGHVPVRGHDPIISTRATRPRRTSSPARVASRRCKSCARSVLPVRTWGRSFFLPLVCPLCTVFGERSAALLQPSTLNHVLSDTLNHLPLAPQAFPTHKVLNLNP